VGKSSLVSAGLVPRLAQRRHAWIVLLPFVPEDRPVRSLARALAALGHGQPVGRMVARLRSGPRGFADCLEEVRAALDGASFTAMARFREFRVAGGRW
jgi:hypothetical protein